MSNRGSDRVGRSSSGAGAGAGRGRGRGSDRGGDSDSSSVLSCMPDAPLAAKCLSLLLILMHSNSNSNKKKYRSNISSNNNNSSSSRNGNSNGIMNGTVQGGTDDTSVQRPGQGQGQGQESVLMHVHQQSLKPENVHQNERQSKGAADNTYKNLSVARPSSSSSSSSSFSSSSSSSSCPSPYPCLNPIREFFCLLQDESVITHTPHGYGHGIHALANGKLVAGVFYQVIILTIHPLSHLLILYSPPLLLLLRPHPHLLSKSSPSPSLDIIRCKKHKRQ